MPLNAPLNVGLTGAQRWAEWGNALVGMADITRVATELTRLSEQAGPEPASRVAALLGIEAVFGGDLATHLEFGNAVERAYRLLLQRGARDAIASCG